MKNLVTVTIIAAALSVPMVARSDIGGVEKYRSCAVCHGETGQGNADMGSPALAGQDSAYLERQLQHFKSGIRGADPRDTGGIPMKAIAGVLAEDDISVVAAYLSSLPPPIPDALPEGDLKNGNNYYQSKCGACHGGEAQGNVGLNAPALAMLDSVYLKQQFYNFQQGVRGAHPEDKYGRQMAMMSSTLPSDKDLNDVVAYIQSMAMPL